MTVPYAACVQLCPPEYGSNEGFYTTELVSSLFPHIYHSCHIPGQIIRFVFIIAILLLHDTHCEACLITYILSPWVRVLLEKLTVSAASQEIPCILEPEVSSPYSQVPANCPYLEPTPSSPHNPLPLPEDPS